MLELLGFGVGWLIGKSKIFGSKREAVDYYDEDLVDLVTYLELCKREKEAND